MPIRHGPRIARPWSISLEIHALRIAALIVAAGRGMRAVARVSARSSMRSSAADQSLATRSSRSQAPPLISDIQVVIHATTSSSTTRRRKATRGGFRRPSSAVRRGRRLFTRPRGPCCFFAGHGSDPRCGAPVLSAPTISASSRPCTSASVIAALAVTDTLKRSSGPNASYGDRTTR